MAEAWQKVGSVRKNEKGNFYLKVDSEVSLVKGDVLQLQDPRKKIADSLAAGRIDEGKATDWLAKIPEYIKFDVVLPPRK